MMGISIPWNMIFIWTLGPDDFLKYGWIRCDIADSKDKSRIYNKLWTYIFNHNSSSKIAIMKIWQFCKYHDDNIKWKHGVTGPLCGEFTDHTWIPLTKANDVKLWCFLHLNKWLIMMSLWCHCNDLVSILRIPTLERLDPPNESPPGGQQWQYSIQEIAYWVCYNNDQHPKQIRG